MPDSGEIVYIHIWRGFQAVASQERIPIGIIVKNHKKVSKWNKGFTYTEEIFGLGPNANDYTKNVLKILQTSPETLKKLDQHNDVPNIGEEHNSDRPSSQKVVLKLSGDTFDRCDPSEFLKYKDQSLKNWIY